MDAHQKTLGSCDRYKERVCAKEGKNIPIIKGGERGYMQVHFRTIEEWVYQTLEVISNGTSVFHRKEGQKKENGSELLVSK